MTEHVESHDQSGGITAHSVNITNQINVTHRTPLYKKKKVVIPAALLLISTVVAVINHRLPNISFNFALDASSSFRILCASFLL